MHSNSLGFLGPAWAVHSLMHLTGLPVSPESPTFSGPLCISVVGAALSCLLPISVPSKEGQLQGFPIWYTFPILLEELAFSAPATLSCPGCWVLPGGGCFSHLAQCPCGRSPADAWKSTWMDGFGQCLGGVAPWSSWLHLLPHFLSGREGLDSSGLSGELWEQMPGDVKEA